MCAHAQGFRYAFPTTATVLRGIGGWHRDDLTPGACCLGFEDAAERCPARITDALGEMTIPYHIGDPQIFESRSCRTAQQETRRLVMEIGPLALDCWCAASSNVSPSCGACSPFATAHALLAFAMCFSALRWWRGSSTTSPSAVTRNTFKPDINACLMSVVATAAQELRRTK